METQLDYYQDIVTEFLRAYVEDRVNEAQYLGVRVSGQPETDEQLLNTVQGQQAMTIARAAGGEVDGMRRDEVTDCCTGLLQRLFAVPGEAEYDIPRAFWMGDFGNMVLLGMVWGMGDELLTVSQAVEMTGKPHDYFTHAVQRGRLISYPDKSEPNPKHQTRLLRSEIEALR